MYLVVRKILFMMVYSKSVKEPGVNTLRFFWCIQWK